MELLDVEKNEVVSESAVDQETVVIKLENDDQNIFRAKSFFGNNLKKSSEVLWKNFG